MYKINATTIKEGKITSSRDITMNKTMSQLAEFFFANGSIRVDTNKWVFVWGDELLIHTATQIK